MTDIQYLLGYAIYVIFMEQCLEMISNNTIIIVKIPHVILDVIYTFLLGWELPENN